MTPQVKETKEYQFNLESRFVVYELLFQNTCTYHNQWVIRRPRAGDRHSEITNARVKLLHGNVKIAMWDEEDQELVVSESRRVSLANCSDFAR